MRWLERLRSRRALGRTVRLWYHPEYLGPDPLRGERILIQLIDEGLVAAKDVERAPVAAVGDLRRFHSLEYLESTTSAETLARIFGAGPEEVDVDAQLRAQRRATGGTIEAAVAAVRSRMTCFNLGGGFHHAEPEMGSGFCVYNDVGVAIRKLRHRGYSHRIAIVDLDYHQGNGNTAAFENDDSVLVFSIHGSVWAHRDRGAEFHLTKDVDDHRYLSRLHVLLEPTLARFGPRLIFYVAGNDVLAEDRLGDYLLTPSGVLERDVHVLDVAKALDASVVVTLGGGYSENAWRPTADMIRYALTGRARVTKAPARDVRHRFRKIAETIDPLDLTVDDGELTEADLFDAFVPRPPEKRILGFYSAQGVEYALERYGLLPQVRKRGYRELIVEIDPSDPEHQLFRLKGRKRPHEPLVILVEVVLRTHHFTAEKMRFKTLHVEWMLLQDPSRGFTLDRPPLPGQEHPGLGIAEELQLLLLEAVRRLALDGLSNNPSHFHVAAGSKGLFWDPEEEGRFRALKHAFRDLSPAEASTRAEKHWTAGLFILPTSDRLRAYVSSPDYQARVELAISRALEAWR